MDEQQRTQEAGQQAIQIVSRHEHDYSYRITAEVSHAVPAKALPRPWTEHPRPSCIKMTYHCVCGDQIVGTMP